MKTRGWLLWLGVGAGMGLWSIGDAVADGWPAQSPVDRELLGRSELDAALGTGATLAACGTACVAGNSCVPPRDQATYASLECSRCFVALGACVAGRSCGSPCNLSSDCNQLGSCTTCLQGHCAAPSFNDNVEVTLHVSGVQRGPRFRWVVWFPDEGGAANGNTIEALPEGSLRVVTSGSVAGAPEVLSVVPQARTSVVVTVEAEFAGTGTIRLDYLDEDIIPLRSPFVADNTTGETYQVDPSLPELTGLAFAYPASSDATVAEGVGPVPLTLTQSGAAAIELCYLIEFSGSARRSYDYALPGEASDIGLPLCVPAGETFHTLGIDIVDDPFVEPDETLVASTGGLAATLTVASDPGDALELADLRFAVGRMSESQGNEIEMTLTQSETAPFAVCHEVDMGGEAGIGSDYVVASATDPPLEGGDFRVCVPAGALSAVVSLRAEADGLTEGDERVFATSENGLFDATFVRDQQLSEIPQASPVFGSATVLERGSVNLQIAQSGTSGYKVCHELDYGADATRGEDFVASWFACLAANVESAVISFNTVDDTVYEGDELASVSIGGNSASVLILEGEPAPEVTGFAADTTSLVEAGGQATLTLTQDAGAAIAVCQDLSYAGAAARGEDYTAPDQLCVPPFETTGTATVHAVDDASWEGNESLTVSTGAYSAQSTIVDDDPPPRDVGVDVQAGTSVGREPGTLFWIVVSNLGEQAESARVLDMFDPWLGDVTWTCDAVDGASCPTAGTGDIDANVQLPDDGSVMFTVLGRVSEEGYAAALPIGNTASVSVVPPDDNLANDSDTATIAPVLLLRDGFEVEP